MRIFREEVETTYMTPEGSGYIRNGKKKWNCHLAET
ncbi:hypothetical protein ASN18_1945 [Candidatus Magnetominusculus xianensis]|uniref:Uncharacterized protein n=1 Tax=Candidatus Magnetominusculus xianensis TaxID=1748249 RepID=A0ABR5SEF8_9BACT|nr:hypothetical protein ASN18_1945 [Candidatus Magnetominusculus xianensis]